MAKSSPKWLIKDKDLFWFFQLLCLFSMSSASVAENGPDQVVPESRTNEENIGQSGRPPVDIVKALQKIKPCANQCQNERLCPSLHICQHFLYSGRCNFYHVYSDGNSSCRYGHDLNTDHNKAILSGYGLDDMSIDNLRDRLSLIGLNVGAVRVCSKYNTRHRRNSATSHDPRGDDCDALHICENFLYRKCDEVNCRLSHDIQANNCPGVLSRYGQPAHSTEILKDIKAQHLPIPLEDDPNIPRLF